MNDIVRAVRSAALWRPELMTGDSIKALAGGHGMLNVTSFCAANAIAEKIRGGTPLKVEALNQTEIRMDSLVEAGVQAAISSGADASNAALITATLCYIAGSNVRAGVPSGNRKLGAMARLKAGVQRGGVMTIPTPKSNNRISGFPAVLKIYEAMLEGTLTRIDGTTIPAGIGGGPLCGHRTLGEDIIFPEVAENAAFIGTSAMMKAYAGSGMKPNPLISAIFGAAASLEIVHPDAVMPERYGTSFKTYTSTVAGLGAVRAAGLPEVLHFRVTGEEVLTANVVGDLGIIMKDMGSPTVVGMLAFYELLAVFEENAKIGAGSSGGPRTAPIGHCAADASLGLRIIAQSGSVAKAAEVIAENKKAFFDVQYASIEAHTVARMVNQLRPGEVSDAVLMATNPVVERAIEERVYRTVNEIRSGKSLSDIISLLEQERTARVEACTSAIASQSSGKTVEIKIDKLAGGARRSGKPGKLFYVLDPDVDVSVRVDGQQFVMKKFLHEVVPNAVLENDKTLLQVIPLAAPAVGELLVSGHSLIDLVVPVATAAVLGVGSPEELAQQAASPGTLVTGGLPGGAARAAEVARLAVQFSG